MIQYLHPVIGLIIIADGVKAVSWSNDSNGSKAFIDVDARHPNLISVCLYDTCNYGILCRRIHVSEGVDIMDGVQYGVIVAKHINTFLMRRMASEALGL